MNTLFATILAASAALALSAPAAANPVSLGIQIMGGSDGPEIAAVFPGHAGEALGFRTGDILLEAGGEPISQEVFMDYMQDKKAGDLLSFKVKREDAVIELTGQAVHVAANPVSLGVQISMTPEGPEIVDLLPDRTGAAVGFKTGDILIEAGGEPISPEVLMEYMKERKPGDQVSFKVKRANAVIELSGEAIAMPQGSPAPTAQ